MKIELLLDNKHSQRLALLKHIESTEDGTLSKKEIIESLNLSPFLLKQLIEGLEEDFQRLHLETIMNIEEKNSRISLKKQTGASSAIIEYEYLKESQTMSLLQKLFFGNYINVVDLSLEYFVSTSSIYRLLDKIKIILSEEDLELDRNKKITGNERKIRQFFSIIMYTIYKDDFRYYPSKYIRTVDIFFHKLENHYGLDKTSPEFYQLKHCLLVSLIRINEQKSYLKYATYTDMLFFQDITLQQLINQLFAEHSDTSRDLHTEKNELLTYIYIYQLIPIKIMNHVNDQLIQLVELLYEQLGDQTYETRIEFWKPKLIESLKRCFFHYLYFKPEILLEKKENKQYLIELNPITGLNIEQFLNRLEENQKDLDVKRYREVLFFELYILLVKYFPHLESIRKIDIYLDFPWGSQYTFFIEQMVLEIADPKQINFTRLLSASTDIIITNAIRDKKYLNRAIIWPYSPTTKDRENLRKKIKAIQLTRAHAQIAI